MHAGCWIQQVTTRVGAVTCWIQQPVSPKQVVGFSCLFNSEVDQLISKARVLRPFMLAISLKAKHTLRCKIKVSNSILIRKFQNNPKQCTHPKTYSFRNVFERFSSRFELFSNNFGSFSHNFLHLFGVVVATLFSTSSSIDRSNTFQKRYSKEH